MSPDGHLEIAAVTKTDRKPQRVFDWREVISVPEGGLQEHGQEFPFDAPETGYQPRVEFNMVATSKDWKQLIEKDYFIRTGSPPKYGRIRVHLNGASQFITVHYWFNPSGSTDLEPVRSKQAFEPWELP